ncbi:uncharacterized protein LAJ45_11089 [Morchella importuna]|uniref:uncharacterized protein n=1 Tax=Morchella importuna TaxID=1174673 RepID=UPI001E8D8A3A|nr:uncharacterized protein LAJ45_11089 [Morchella importuna]KAH8144884.1 hypothetical protein LAJ45_11089 [Morchella importuna]
MTRLDQLFKNTLYDIHDAETLAHRSLLRPRTPSQELARNLTKLTLHTGHGARYGTCTPTNTASTATDVDTSAKTPEISIEELTHLFSRLSLEPAPVSPGSVLILALREAVATPLEGIAEEDEGEESDGTMYSCDEGSDRGSEGTVNEWDEWLLEDEEVVDVQVGVADEDEEEVDAEANRVMDAIVFKSWIQVVPWVV